MKVNEGDGFLGYLCYMMERRVYLYNFKMKERRWKKSGWAGQI